MNTRLLRKIIVLFLTALLLTGIVLFAGTTAAAHNWIGIAAGWSGFGLLTTLPQGAK